jgi:hypothetical protein
LIPVGNILTPIELQQEQPNLYGSLTTNLGPVEQEVVQSVFVQADHNAQQAAILAQQQAIAASGSAA